MTIVKYLFSCLASFLDVWSGNGIEDSWLKSVIGFILIALTFAMYFLIYWRVVSPKCYKLWLCTVLTFLVCVALWIAFILLCVSGEWIVSGIF